MSAAAPCTTAQPGLCFPQRLRNASTSGLPHRQRGIFMPEIRPDFSQPPMSGIGGMRVTARPRAALVRGFSDPPVPGTIAGFHFALESNP